MTDKPAATVHGTGNGEAKDWFESMPSLSDVPTPPTSPTVTVDRETFDKLVAKAESIERAAVHGTFYHTVAIEMLVLLKAAEKEQH